MKKQYKKVVLAYSGGLDTSVIIPWLKENYGCEVIAMAADVGQEDDFKSIEEKALASGASKCYIVDLKEEFVTGYLWPLIKSGAIYESKYLLGTSVARPLIAKQQVEIARAEGADALAHGCTGKGNDQVRFELTYKALAPDLDIIAPWRVWEIRSREDAMDYAAKHGVPVPVTKAKPYSRDNNLWHISHEGGDLEDPWNTPQEDMYVLTDSPLEAPDQPEEIVIGFEKGVPVSLNGEELPGLELVKRLNALAGKHGVGRVDIVENRLVGMKSRGVYETPGGTILYLAHQDLESITLDRETHHYKELVAHKYAELVYYGLWYTPLKKALDAFIDVTQANVTGEVKMRLYKGSCTAVGRRSPYSLYSPDLATFGEDAVYDQSDAKGFINLFGLPLTVQALLAQDK
ncbi:MAG: argininosuccinate synthase [Firmicutes bacterium]|nr:argininosuccinate synthase [Bacillota bacterium]